MKRKVVATVVILAVISIAFIICSFSNKEGYTEVTPSQVEKLVDSGKQVYVYFYSENCVTCRKIKSNLKKLKKENNRLQVYGINVDDYIESDFIEEYAGYKVPKLVEFIDGSKYKELEDKSIDALRQFIVVDNDVKKKS